MKVVVEMNINIIYRQLLWKKFHEKKCDMKTSFNIAVNDYKKLEDTSKSSVNILQKYKSKKTENKL